jgi:hypothetical protein
MVAILVGQFSGDALAQDVEVTHQLGQGAGGTHGRLLGGGCLQQGEYLKLLGVAQSLGFACHRFPLWPSWRA